MKELAIEIINKVYEDMQNRKMILAWECKKLKRLEIVVAIPIPGMNLEEDFNNYIGYPVQIRKGGAFGSDTVLFRRLDGTLLRWENQGFILLTSKEKEQIKPYFEALKEDEKNQCYKIENKNEKCGYIIEKEEVQ